MYINISYQFNKNSTVYFFDRSLFKKKSSIRIFLNKMPGSPHCLCLLPVLQLPDGVFCLSDPGKVSGFQPKVFFTCEIAVFPVAVESIRMGCELVKFPFSAGQGGIRAGSVLFL